MKITEALQKDSKKPVLTAYVDKDTGVLVDIMDRAKRETNETLLAELIQIKSDENTPSKDKLEIDGKISLLRADIERIIPYEFELSNPTFEVLSVALGAIYATGGNLDVMSSGKVVFDACYTGNQGELEEIQKHASLYISLCSKCYHSIVEIADIEYKKK